MLTKPTFHQLASCYPAEGSDFGDGGHIIDNGAYSNACALRLSAALCASVEHFMDHYRWVSDPPRHAPRSPRPDRARFLLARSASRLAHHLRTTVGWMPDQIWNGAQGRRRAQRLDATQGIIYWKVIPEAEQIALRDSTHPIERLRRNYPSPNHIDLWDPADRELLGVSGGAGPRARVGGRTMMWAPPAEIVAEVLFWELPRGVPVHSTQPRTAVPRLVRA